MRLAGIDIGSNAARLLITEVQKNENEDAVFNKVDLIRVPLRLGFDVFEQGVISEERKSMLLNTMIAFKYLLKAYNVSAVKACATSAMRDAANSKEIIETVKEKTGIEISIISGEQEASLVFENHIADVLTHENAYLYIDVGGGSTEIDFFLHDKQLYKKSFNIGTIRLLQNKWNKADWKKTEEEIKKNVRAALPVIAIGTGGNINKVFSISKTKEKQPLSLQKLKVYYKFLSALSVKERMKQFDLKADRADVIVPALEIYIKIMTWVKADKIIVPHIGVADGLVRDLYKEMNDEKDSIQKQQQN